MSNASRSFSSIRSHFRAVSFFIFLPGVLAGDLTSAGPVKVTFWRLESLLSRESEMLILLGALLTSAELRLGTLDCLRNLVGERPRRSRSSAPILLRRDSFSFSRFDVYVAQSAGSTYTTLISIGQLHLQNSTYFACPSIESPAYDPYAHHCDQPISLLANTPFTRNFPISLTSSSHAPFHLF